jgi:putative endonuclease
MKFYVYVLLCADGTYYTGWTLDLERRIKEHNSKNSKTKYTRSRRPVKLYWFWPYNSKSEVMKAEYEIKQLSHVEKKNLDRAP